MKLNKCDTVATGNLLINSSGTTKKSVQSFTLPTTTGTLALTSDIPDTSNFITASSTNTLTNKSIFYGQITSRPFEVSYSNSLLFANYLSIFKTVDNRCMLFTNSSFNYRHGIKHNDANLEFYLSTTDDGYTGQNLIYDISTDGLKLNVCNTVTSGNLLINSDGLIKQSSNEFTLPESSGTLALQKDIDRIDAILTNNNII